MKDLIDYTKVHPSHWGYVEEMPKIEEYMIGICESGTCRDCGETKDCGYRNFDNTLSIWKSKYGEEPKPPLGAEDWDYFKAVVRETVGDELSLKWFEWHDKYKFWNYHQKKYEGWELSESDNWFGHHIEIEKNGIGINFVLDKNYMSIEFKDLSYQGSIITTTGLKEIAKVNGIEL